MISFLRRSPSNATWESSLLNTFEASFARGDNFAIYLIAVFIICALVLAILEFGFILNGKVKKRCLLTTLCFFFFYTHTHKAIFYFLACFLILFATYFVTSSSGSDARYYTNKYP